MEYVKSPSVTELGGMVAVGAGGGSVIGLGVKPGRKTTMFCGSRIGESIEFVKTNIPPIIAIASTGIDIFTHILSLLM